MGFDLLERRRTKFTLWIPGRPSNAPPPGLVIGTFSPGSPPTVHILFSGSLVGAGKQDLWELNPNSIDPPLVDGQVYHYWFEVADPPPSTSSQLVTDPFGYTVDYRPTRSRDDNIQPATVIKFRDGKLWPCDLDGRESTPVSIPKQQDIPDNNHMVIYELPTSWTRPKDLHGTLVEDGKSQRVRDLIDAVTGSAEVDVGTFTDVLALFEKDVAGDKFKNVPQVAEGAIVAELGINALELLPAADARPVGEWGYATANYCAPDFDFGPPSGLNKLVEALHTKKTRLITDFVMAFGHDPYAHIAFDQFHLDPRSEKDNPDSKQSHSTQLRDGYGGSSWRYLKDISTYDPQSGQVGNVHPSWSFHRAHLHRWMTDFGVGGYRLDSVNNIGNYDFVRTFKEDAWQHYSARYSGTASGAKFIVIGEELSVPPDLLTTGTLNAMWNEPWQGRLRAVIIGEQKDDDFEWTVRKMVDCRLDSNRFTDGAQAVNYITSHDTEGFRKERLYNYLINNKIGSATDTTETERRAKLAFACLLTAVGIPMIFAGDEFCDQHDVPISQKQVDPVNYSRRSEPWRSRVFDYVANLVKFRQTCPALGDNDTDFIHVDTSRYARIMAWKRGGQGNAPVVVVANFSAAETPGDQYMVPNWPERERADWREVTAGWRSVPSGTAGTEKLGAWEARVYTYWK